MSVRPMRPRVWTLVVAIPLMAPVAMAQEWRLNGSVSQRVEADSNKRVDPDTPGGVIGFTTGLDLALEAVTQRTNWRLEGGLRAQRYFGEGADDTLDRTDPSLSGSVEFQGKRYQATSSFALSRRATSLTEFEETGVVDQDVTQTRVRLDSGITYSLDALNRIGLTGFTELRRFSEDSAQFSPSTTYGIETSWSRNLSALTTASLSVGVRQFTSDGQAQDTESTILDLGGRLNHLLTEEMDLGVGAGLTINSSQRTPTGLAAEEDVFFGFRGDFQLRYRTDDTSLTFGASQGLEPSTDGSLINRTRVTTAATYRFNPTWDVAMGASYGRQTNQDTTQGLQSDEARQSVSIGPTLSATLTRDWRLQVGYALRLTDSAEGGAVSNNVFVGISRDLAFAP